MTINLKEEEKIIDKWQTLLNVIAKIDNIPAALIMKVHSKEIEVFLSSESKGNPYEEGELASLNTNLYCETVMATRDILLVKNAFDDPDWKDNPDTKLNMNFYLGVPIIWPNREIFGTLCVLDTNENKLAVQHTGVLMNYKHTIEKDLADIYWREIIYQYRKTHRDIEIQNDDKRDIKKQLIRFNYLNFISNKLVKNYKLSFLYKVLKKLV